MKGQRIQGFILLVCLWYTRASSVPDYCSYIESDGYFECDYSKMSDPAYRPIDFSQFDPVPQRLKLNVNGYLPYYNDTRVFTEDIANISVSDFDNNYPASLEIDCEWYGSIFFSTGAFANMSYIQHLKIKNCYTYDIPAETFADLVNLDYFSFEGGRIDFVHPDGTGGVNVEKLNYESHTFPQTLGHFEVRNCRFNSKTVPPGLLFNWKNLSSVALVNADINTIHADVFRYTTKVRYIDLSDNLFISIPSGIFDGLDSLAEVSLYNIDWFCSCGDLWWYDYTKSNNITVKGDLICHTPSGISVARYWAENCIEVEICGGQIGIVWEKENRCITIFDFLRYGFSLIAFILMIPILAFMIHFKRQLPGAGASKPDPVQRWNSNTAFNMSKLKTPQKSDDRMDYGEKPKKERKSSKADEVQELKEFDDRRERRKRRRRDRVRDREEHEDYSFV